MSFTANERMCYACYKEFESPRSLANHVPRCPFGGTLKHRENLQKLKQRSNALASTKAPFGPSPLVPPCASSSPPSGARPLSPQFSAGDPCEILVDYVNLDITHGMNLPGDVNGVEIMHIFSELDSS